MNRKIVLDALRQLTLLSGTSKENNDESSEGKTVIAEQPSTVLDEDNQLCTPLPGSTAAQTSTSPVLCLFSCGTNSATEKGSAYNSSSKIQELQLTQHQPSSVDLANSTYVKDFSRLVVVEMSSQTSDLGSGGMLSVTCINFSSRFFSFFPCSKQKIKRLWKRFLQMTISCLLLKTINKVPA